MENLEKWFVGVLEGQRKISVGARPYYLNWLKRFLAFCRTEGLDAGNPLALEEFLRNLSISRLRKFQYQQLLDSIKLYLEHSSSPNSGMNGFIDSGMPKNGAGSELAISDFDSGSEIRIDSCDLSSGSGQKNRMDWNQASRRLTDELKFKHYSPKTLKSYLHWIRAFQDYLRERAPVRCLTPEDLDSGDAKTYLSFLALEKEVSAASQNQAFHALQSLYVRVLGKEFNELGDTPRAKRPKSVPVVLTQEEVQAVLSRLQSPFDLCGQLLYGCGLRLQEVLRLRVQDVDFGMGMLVIHHGKGGKSRRVPLPARALPGLRVHLEKVRAGFEDDIKVGFSGAFMPDALDVKYPGAART